MPPSGSREVDLVALATKPVCYHTVLVVSVPVALMISVHGILSWLSPPLQQFAHLTLN
jgi:hypothetical protein